MKRRTEYDHPGSRSPEEEANLADANPDMITGRPGAHPIGTRVGAVAAGLTGAAIGAAVGGPVGAVVGVLAGGVTGALIGRNTAEAVNPTLHDDYWAEHHEEKSGELFEHYAHAYRLGTEAYQKYGTEGACYADFEEKLREDYESIPDATKAPWVKARMAVHDAWHKTEKTMKENNVTNRDFFFFMK